MKIQEKCNLFEIIEFIVKNYEGASYDLVENDVSEFIEKNLRMGYLKYGE